MKERPILFSAPMVRAILDGKKTQTRRILKSEHVEDAAIWAYDETRAMWESGIASGAPGSYGHGEYVRCPYGTPGDQLWMRETWSLMNRERTEAWTRKAKDRPNDAEVVFRADENHSHKAWRPSIFMPRWASRVSLNVTGIRVERLHSITETDSWAEGIDAVDGMLQDAAICRAARIMGCCYEDARAMYGALWAEINGEDSLRANPWVWVVEFKRVGQASRSTGELSSGILNATRP